MIRLTANASPSFSETSLARARAPHQRVDLFARVVHRERRARGRRNAEPLHHRLRAVMTRCGSRRPRDRRSCRCRADGRRPSRTTGCSPCARAVPISRRPSIDGERCGAVLEQRLLRARRSRRTRSTGCSRSPRRARSRRRCPACPPRTCTAASFQVDFSNVTELNHVAAAEERRHRFEQRFLAVEDADARRAVQLVSGRRVEVAVERLDVDRHVVRGLRSVDEHRHAARVRDADDLLDGIDRAERVRHVRRPRRASSARQSALRTRRASARRDRRSARPAAARRAPRRAAATARCSSGAPSPR